MRQFLPLTCAAIVAAAPIGGCASVFDASDRTTIKVDSKPQGARVRLDGADRGVTPLELNLSDKESYELTVTHGGETRSVQLTRSVAPVWIILDVLFGVIPVIVDAITGNWFDISPTTVFFDFTAGAEEGDTLRSGG
jgi:hypothetical protein